HCTNALVWLIMIFIYAMFIPNTWRRALLVVLLMAATPLIQNQLVEWQQPALAVIMPTGLNGVLTLLIVIGVGCAVYGTHLINNLRIQTFASETRARAIFNTTPEGIIISDARGTITSFNPAAERLFGYAATEAIGKNVSILMPHPDREHHDAHIARYLQTRQ